LFSQDAAVKVFAGIQIAGSTSLKASNWLRAWANSNLPSEFLSDAKQVRSFGQMNGNGELIQPYVTDAGKLTANSSSSEQPIRSPRRCRRGLLSNTRQHQSLFLDQ
jgi:hypothetical protein